MEQVTAVGCAARYHYFGYPKLMYKPN